MQSYLKKIASYQESATDRVQQVQADLLKAVNALDARGIASESNRLQEALGEQHGLALAKAYCSREEATEVTFLMDVADLLGRGSDDSWSGRGNDAQRAFFDGVRRSIERVVGLVKFCQ